MGLITKKVYQKWHTTTRKHYESKGYIFTKYGDEFLIKVNDLTDGSNVLVEIECDGCSKKIENIKWHLYLNRIKIYGKIYCKKCAMKLYGGGVQKRLTDEFIHEIINKKLGWQVLKINRINNSIRVDLLDNNGYMYSDVNITNIRKGSIPLKFYVSNKYVINNIKHWCKLNGLNIMFVDTYKKAIYKSNWRCLECGKIFSRSWSLVQSGFISCKYCGDGISYPNKFGRGVFMQLNNHLHQHLIDYIPEFISDWTKNYIYDFCFDDLKIVVEFHGLQHYKYGFEFTKGKTLEQEQENDRLKKELAEANGFKYIEIDCRRSDMEWIKNSILNSELAEIFDLSQIDWLKCHEFALSNLVKEACKLWNSGIKSTVEIGRIMNLSRPTIITYLKHGKKLKWCNYNPKTAMKENGVKKSSNNNKQVLQLSLDGKIIQEFISASAAGREINMHHSAITACCRGIQKTAKGYKWMYKENYCKNIDN